MSLANKLSHNKLGYKMIIKNCKVCGADIKLKKDVSIALSCSACYKVATLEYQWKNPHAGGWLGRTYNSRMIANYGKVAK